MAHVNVETPDLALDSPILIDGLPGMGLIGKLVADHLIDEFGMEYYAGVHCAGIPRVAAYGRNDSTVRPPVQIYADEERDLLALVSDVPVSSSAGPEFADCLVDWLDEHGVTPVFLSALTGTGGDDADRADDGNGNGDGDGAASGDGDAPERELYGLATGDGEALLRKAGIDAPPYAGIVSGPAGALLNRAGQTGLTGVGLLVEGDDELPDVDAAQTVIERAIEPIAGVEIDVEPFVDRSIEVSELTQSFLDQVHGSGDGSSQAQPTPTFH